MNWEHFRTFLWLRWRLSLNQTRRAGTANAVLLALAAVAVVLASLGLSVAAFVVSLYGVKDVSPTTVMLIWDGLVVLFLFFSMIGLITELQRSEALSLDKFLHLPVAVKGAFIINYVSSLFSLVLLMIVPAMVSMSLATVVSRGPAALLLLPLVLAFVLMVTAVLYQFRGWLAALMVNKRRRRTIVVTLTALLILMGQAPQLLNVIRPWDRKHEVPAGKAPSPEEANARRAEAQRKQWEQVRQVGTVVNACLPPGWLPLGALAVAEGNFAWVVACTLGMALLGTASLWRAYVTTVRMYTGQGTAGQKPSPAQPAAAATTSAPAYLLEKELPWVPEQAAAVALASFQSLMRAPEAKLALLSVFVMMLIFGTMALTRAGQMPEMARPLLPFGAMALTLLSSAQFVGNQFGLDRSGFRVFVLSPAQRGNIILGKNLAFAPLALGLGLTMTLLIQAVAPLRVDLLAAAVVQQLSMFLLFCTVANFLSILAPIQVAAGSMKPVKMNLLPTLFYLLFTLALPLVLGPTLLPLGVELLLDRLEWGAGVPTCLLLSLLGGVAVALLYWFLLPVQGRLLQSREQKILEAVTTKAE